MNQILVSWIGSHDLDAEREGRLGPILSAIRYAEEAGAPYVACHFLFNYVQKDVDSYLAWLKSQTTTFPTVTSEYVNLSSPSAYKEIYPAADAALARLFDQHPETQKTVHLSPGTPAMAAVWILLVKTRFPARCIESWLDRETGEQRVNEVELPFDIDARFTVEATQRSNHRLEALQDITSETIQAFQRIAGQETLKDPIRKATKLAQREVPALILGETGTGKEVFANAIHEASARSDGAFVPVNCGALPSELAESLLFGHVKGAFTGATSDHKGYFSQADEGTLFLDEIGELPLALQVKLLRALQEKTFIPVGSDKSVRSNFRLIAATNQNLMGFVQDGRFREDLFYRIAVGVIKLPALRERRSDLVGLAQHLMIQINDELADQVGYQRKRITDEALQLVQRQRWPGNVRELRATLLRAAVWSDNQELQAGDLQDALLSFPESANHILAEDISGPIDIEEVVAEVYRHYVPLALSKTGWNKTRAASLLGLKSQQVLTNKIKKYDVTY